MALFKPGDYVLTYVPNKAFFGYGKVAKICSERFEEASEIKPCIVGKYIVRYCNKLSHINYPMDESYMFSIALEDVVIRGLEEGWL